MKKILFCLITLTSALSAQSDIKFRVAGFYHFSPLFRDIYGDWGVCYEGEVTTSFYRYLDGWVNFDWFSEDGKSIGFGDPTRVSIANLSFGIKIPYQFHPQFRAYLGAGPSVSWIHVKNECACCTAHSRRTVLGGIIKTGVYFYVNPNLFLDLFCDILYQPVRFESNVDIGGIKPGLGIGYRF